MHKTREKQTPTGLKFKSVPGVQVTPVCLATAILPQILQGHHDPTFGSLGEGPMEHSGFIKLRAIPPFLPAFCLSWSATLPKPKCYYIGVFVQLLTHVQLLVTSWTVAHQAPVSMGLLLPWTQGLNPIRLYWQADSLPLSHQGTPYIRVHEPQKTKQQ